MKFQISSPILLLIMALLICSSCVSKKKIAYFQDLDSLESTSKKNSEKNIKIQAGDILNIVVSAPELQAAQPFNNFTPTPGAGNVSGGAERLSYLVSEQGKIDFPTLGEIEVTGLTGKELEFELKKKLVGYLQDPVVTVRVENFQITILGEVRSPGTFEIKNDDISLPKALGLAGDITLSGKRDNVLIVREVDGVKTHVYLNLTKADVINSPFYYLKQDDVIYIEPIGPKIQSTSYLGTTASYLSIASVALSLIFLFTK